MGNSNGAKACKVAVEEGISATFKAGFTAGPVVEGILAIGEINLLTFKSQGT